MKPLGQYFDHTLLKPEAGENDIRRLCTEAKEHELYAVCVNSCYVSLCAEELAGSEVKIAAVVGFPLGACDTATKVFETTSAVDHGAHEIDMVLQVGALKEERDDYVLDDIKAVVEAARQGDAIVKVILETCLLSEDEIVRACKLAQKAGAAFVKTSTGFNAAGATVEHVSLMKKIVGDSMQVKASGGIRDKEKALAMIQAGADRIGASTLLV